MKTMIVLGLSDFDSHSLHIGLTIEHELKI